MFFTLRGKNCQRMLPFHQVGLLPMPGAMYVRIKHLSSCLSPSFHFVSDCKSVKGLKTLIIFRAWLENKLKTTNLLCIL